MRTTMNTTQSTAPSPINPGKLEPTPQTIADRETFLKTHHVFTGQELEEMWEVISLAASENTVKRMYKAFYEIDKVGA